MPEIEIMQVQFLVKYVVAMVGAMVSEIGGAMSNLGSGIAAQSLNSSSMAELTTGVFGTNSGLLYWLNDYVFDIMARLPYTDLGIGLHQVLTGLSKGTCG